MKQIKFGDIKIGTLARTNIFECLDNNEIACGSKVKKFEDKWAKKFNTNYAVGVNTGSAACLCSLLALYKFGAKRNDKIIVPGLSFVATGTSVIFAGFQPVYCDILINSLTINIDLLEDLIIKYKPIAIMPVTLMGNAYNAKSIRELCDKYNLWLITDNCEGAGCTYEDKYIEEYSDISNMSHYLAHLVIGGQQGTCSCNRHDVRDALLSVRTHGRRPNDLYFDHQFLGSNFLPSNLHACIALEQLEQFDENFNIRKNNWQYLRTKLSDLEDIFYFADPIPNSNSSPHAFSFTFKAKMPRPFSCLSDYLVTNGIEVKRNFGAMYKHGCLSNLGLNENCLNAEWVGDNGGHIGIHRFLDANDLDYFIELLRNYLKR